MRSELLLIALKKYWELMDTKNPSAYNPLCEITIPVLLIEGDSPV